jgi:uncharacterized phage-associated protein
MPLHTPIGLPRWPFALDREKAFEAVLYVAAKLRRPTLHCVAKLLYHADRLHLSRYARPITGDRYVAMKHGPVPSATYNVLKTIRGDERVPLPAGAAESLRVENGYEIRPLRAADLDVLSASEVECLDAAVREHGHKTFTQLTEESHDAAWQAADENDLIELEHLLLTLGNSAELREHFLNDSQ